MRGTNDQGPGGKGGRGADRRRHVRGDVAATVMIEATGKWAGRYACENLSASGGLFVGAGQLAVGDRLLVKLLLPGRAPLELDAHVRRATPRSLEEVAYGVSFDPLSADVEDEIQGAVLASLERQATSRPPAVLVVHELELTRRALERDARALGYEPVTAASVDEALAWLEEPSHDLSAVVVDGHMEPSMRVSLLDRVIEQRPAARRLLLSGLARTSLSSIALTSGHAHAVVTQPWNLQSFGEALRGAAASAADPAS